MKHPRQALQRAEYRVIRSFPDGQSGLVELVDSEIFGKETVRKYVDLFGLGDSLPYDEPRLLDAMKHPRIVRVNGARFTKLEDVRVVVFDMPYYPDGSVLTAFEGQHPFSIVDAVRIVNDALDGLQYVHEHLRYLWRDAKPANILLEKGRTRALLADFGSAARLVDGSAAALGGSLAYRPPEYAAGRLTPAADVYSMGLVLHELLSGPFEYATLDPDEMEHRLQRGQRAINNALLRPSPQVPRALRRVVNKATNPQIAKRYQTAAAFRTALGAVHVIDWRPVPGGWEGKDSGSSRRYRVHETIVRGGQIRLEATRKIGSGSMYRRFGVPDRLVSAGDRDSYTSYFEEVVSVALSR